MDLGWIGYALGGIVIAVVIGVALTFLSSLGSSKKTQAAPKRDKESVNKFAEKVKGDFAGDEDSA